MTEAKPNEASLRSMQGVERPLPEPNPLTRPFWEAAKARKLVIQRCQRCRSFYHPPIPVCPRCQVSGSGLVFEEVSGRGVIYSYTLVHQGRLKSFEKIVPYPVVLVELAEQPGLILYANMPDTKLEDIRVGAPVKLLFVEIGSNIVLPEFGLAER